jgi:hypothetical protein
MLNPAGSLYKMLVYTQGGHFVKHRDTEKEPNMFGTLIVHLPASHQGGDLVVSHCGMEVRLQSAGARADAAQGVWYSAFFADCEHILEPIVSGVRLVLVYNLVFVPKPSGDCDDDDEHAMVPQTGALLAALDEWNKAGQAILPHLMIPLEHRYTPQNVSFGNLKGKDARVAQQLASQMDPATGKPMLRLFLGLFKRVVELSDDQGDMSIWIPREDHLGAVQHGFYYRHHSEQLVCLVGKDGEAYVVDAAVARQINFKTSLLFGAPGDVLGNWPQEQGLWNYTGNEGYKTELTYYGCAIVMVLESRVFDVPLTLAGKELRRCHEGIGIDG